MTITDYNTATDLLAEIEKLTESLTRVEQGISVVAQAEVENQFTDIPLLQEAIELEITNQIAVADAAFAAL